MSLARGGLLVNGGLADTTAVIDGRIHDYALLAPAEVKNFATIIGGVSMRGGGEVVNGAAGDTATSITGSIYVGTTPTTLYNFGLIRGPFSNQGAITLWAGGTVFNGSATDTSAIIDGYGGAVGIANGPGKVVNFGAIDMMTANGNGAGVGLSLGGAILNGDIHDENARISGAYGVVI